MDFGCSAQSPKIVYGNDVLFLWASINCHCYLAQNKSKVSTVYLSKYPPSKQLQHYRIQLFEQIFLYYLSNENGIINLCVEHTHTQNIAKTNKLNKLENQIPIYLQSVAGVLKRIVCNFIEIVENSRDWNMYKIKKRKLSKIT